MAYGGKADSSSLGNFPTTNIVNLKYISGRNDKDSKSEESKYTVIGFNAFKPPQLKDNKFSKGLNSGTPCTSTAFTPLGKPSAISTSKSTAIRNSPIGLKDRSQVFNSGTPCTSKALTPLGKPAALSRAKSTDIFPRKAVIDSKSPPIKNSKSNTTDQSIMRYYANLEESPAMRSVGFNKEFIPSKDVNDSKSHAFKYNKYNTSHQNIMNYYTALENSSAIHTVESNEGFPRRTSNDSKSPPFIDKKFDTTHQNMMEYNISSRKSSTVSSKSFMLGKDSNDSKSPTSETGDRTTFSKYHTRLRKSYPSENPYRHSTDFDFGSRKSEDFCSTQVSSKIEANRASTSVDLLRCIICIDKQRDTVFQPCGHLIVCSNCANNIDSTCPTCRKRIKKKIKAYIN